MDDVLDLDETLARGVFSSSGFSSSTGRVRHGAFLETGAVLSVDRSTHAPIENLVLLGERRAGRRSKSEGTSRKFYGWAKLEVHEAMKENRQVMASPEPDNPYHADIILPDEAPQQRRTQAVDLARRARWRSKPSTPPPQSLPTPP